MDLGSAVHADPYLDDGNVVLAACSKDSTCKVFRVHRSVLCMQSTVFADMFAVPAPTEPAAAEMYAGITLIRMPDDATDLGDLLKMIYDPSCVSSIISRSLDYLSLDMLISQPDLHIVPRS